jgi:hypothetical protein
MVSPTTAAPIMAMGGQDSLLYRVEFHVVE